MLDTALEAHAAGLCVLPPRQDGSKAPDAVEWTRYQHQASSEHEIRAWYRGGRTGLGVVLGPVSGNLELLEFDDPRAYAHMKAVAIDAGLAPLIDRIEAGYLEQSPNGIHWLYRCEEVTGNTKLARRPTTPEERKHPNDNVRVLIETRGAGGFAIIAPSHGSVHPTGKGYVLLSGGFSTIVTITAQERQALFELARTHDQMPRRERAALTAIKQADPDDDERPGDWFNRTMRWTDVLVPAGWVHLFTHRDEDYWRRPGKEHGQSATTNYAGSDLLKVFSTSTPFDTEESYSKFAAWAILNHQGDFSAAAAAVRAMMPAPDRPRHLHVVEPAPVDPPWLDAIEDDYVTEWEPPPAKAAPTAQTGRGAVAPEPPQDQAEEEADLLRIAITGASSRARVPGGTFILDAPDKVEAIWGDSDAVAWPEGEPVMLNGPTGVGKTTLAQQVILGRAGLRSEVLGMPVKQTSKRILYIAADRPKQVARSFRRMVSEADRELLDSRIEVWRGPLPRELTKNPELLVVMADMFGADTIVLDSLKDIAAKLSDDETANRLNHAFQLCSVADIELLVLHHQRKAQADNKKPTSISDVFGSIWITAGMGSVLLVWGEPGDPVVELSHLKQPAEPVGPLSVVHDHSAGRSTVEPGVDLLSIVRTSNGLTPEGAARAIFRKEKVNRNEQEKAKRKLLSLVDKGLVVPREQGRSAATGQQLPTRYYAVGPHT